MTLASEWLHGKITDEAIVTLRSRCGRRESLGPESDPFTLNQIMRYLACVGDDNPLYWDEPYAAKTRWAGVIAPPRLLPRRHVLTPRVLTTPRDGGRVTFMGEDVLKGVFAMISGVRIVFERPVRLGDTLRWAGGPHDVIERRSKMAGRSLELINKIEYFNQRDELVATSFESVIRMERSAARASRKYLDVPNACYTVEEMESLGAQYELERLQRRGGVPRYWEDTSVGDNLIKLAKGPLSITDIASFFAGHGIACQTNRTKHLELKASPAERLLNPETNIEDHWVAAHWDSYFARQSGIPRPYDEGPMRFDDVAHLVTDWMGDDAFLRELQVSLRKPNLVGDLSWCTGKVANKRVDELGRYVVDLEMWMVNQREERTTTASAIVELPARDRRSR